MKRLVLFIIVGLLVPVTGFAATTIVMKPQVEVSCTTGGVRLLPANPIRTYLVVVNKGSQTVYYGTDAPTSGTNGIPITTGGNYEFNTQAPSNAIYCTSSSGTQTVVVQEGY